MDFLSVVPARCLFTAQREWPLSFGKLHNIMASLSGTQVLAVQIRNAAKRQDVLDVNVVVSRP